MKLLLILALLLTAVHYPAKADDVEEIRVDGQFYETDGEGAFWHNGSRFRGFDE